jgi:tRNA (cytidine/uridine-2'-O-)-methyltransferase
MAPEFRSPARPLSRPREEPRTGRPVCPIRAVSARNAETSVGCFLHEREWHDEAWPLLDARPTTCYPEAVLYEPSMHVVLHQPQIPQNTGNVGRTCVAVGAKLWLVRPLGFRMDTQRLKRAGLDYWDHLEWEAVDDWNSLIRKLPEERLWCFTRHASRSYTDARVQRGDVLVFGSETQGLPPSLRQQYDDRSLCIPILPPVRSLNLATSVAVVAFEARRQWAEREPGS